jgi:hypothetical protein
MRSQVNAEEERVEDITEAFNESWLAFVLKPNKSTIENIVGNLSNVVQESLISLGKICCWEEIGRLLTYENSELYAIPGDNERLAVAGCAMFTVLPFDCLLGKPEIDGEQQQKLVDYMKVQDEFFPSQEFQVIKLVYSFLPYQKALSKNPVLSLITTTLQHLLHAIEPFEKKVMNMPLEQRGRPDRLSLAWKLREEIMKMVSLLGEKYSSALCDIRELQNMMDEFVTTMVALIAKKEGKLSGGNAGGLYNELNSVMLRLDFISQKQLPLLRAYSELTTSIDEFDGIVNDQVSSQKRSAVQPYAERLREQARSFCCDVIAQADTPEGHASIVARSRAFQNKAAEQLEQAENVLQVHRHPKWMRVGVRLMMGVVHLASAFFSRGETREHHCNIAAKLFHDELPVPKSEAISREAIQGIKEQLPSLQSQHQQILAR